MTILATYSNFKSYTGVAITGVAMIHCNNSSSWSTLFWSVERSHKSTSPILTPAKHLAILFDDRRKSAGVPAIAVTVFSTGRRDRRIKSLISDMSVCIGGLRCRDYEFHFGRLIRAGTYYLRRFLQSPSLTS